MLCKKCQKKRKLNKLNICRECNKLRTKSYWKDKLWEALRQTIFEEEHYTCFTCGKRNLEGCDAQLGHFLTGATCPPALYFDRRNLHAQCYYDNINLSGNWPEYERRMIRKYGQGVVDELKRRQKLEQGTKWEIKDYQNELKKYE